MIVTGTIWSSVGGLTFEEAKALAASKGGRLAQDYDWIEAAVEGRLAHSGDDYKRLWVGAELINGKWQLPDGSPIGPNAFGDESVNHDADPTNDAGPVLFYKGLLRSADETVFNGNGGFFSDGFVMEYFTSRIIGTETRDIVMHAWGAKYLDVGGGDDAVGDVGSSTIVNLGTGNDVYWSERSNPTVIDGPGMDAVYGYTANVRPTFDGDSDWFEAAIVSYASANLAITGEYGAVHSAQFGDDAVLARQVTLGFGDDVVSGFDILIGGAGNDTLTANERAEGGDGNDTLIANHYNRVDLKGQAGDDRLEFFTDAKASGGKGADDFIFFAPAKVTINDLEKGDHIDLTYLFGDYSGNVATAFSQGYLKATVSKGYTYLQYDQDGGGNNFADMVTLKGVFHDLADYLII